MECARQFSARARRARCVTCLLALLLLASGQIRVQAQFLRLGPLDFGAVTRFETVYTTNVEGERPSEATAEREDLYFIWSLDLRSSQDVFRRSRLSLDTGVAIEEHVNRPDLNNSEAPFGRASALWETDWNPLKFYASALWERTSESTDDRFVPADFPRKTRQVGTTREYAAGVDLRFWRLSANAEYRYTEERFDDERYADTETNEDEFSVGVGLAIWKYIDVSYDGTWTRTDFINRTDDEPEWLFEEEILINVNVTEAFGLWERPRIEYSIGVEQEFDENGQGEGWTLTHRLSISDEFNLNPRTVMRYRISYDYEQAPEEDDIAFEYGLALDQELSPRARHRFSASRRPVETLGTTQDTDETEFRYGFNLQDFVFADVNAGASVGYTISRPVVGPEERVWDYIGTVSHSKPLRGNWTRKLAYEYTREDSNVEEEILDEHRVTLSFIYTFR